MRPFRQLVYGLVYKPVLRLYLRTEPVVKMNGYRLKVPRGVFHPGLFFSTGFLYRFLQSVDLRKKKFLELGCGSGYISMMAAGRGAYVTAVDLNPAAVDATKINFARNFRNVPSAEIYRSDLFSEVPVQRFDVIAINPPYYFKDPVNMEMAAWHCGVNGQYFHGLFSRLFEYADPDTLVLMCLHEGCEIDRIRIIAGGYGLQLTPEASEKIKWEQNYIFRVTREGR